jgi:hypothetical protein
MTRLNICDPSSFCQDAMSRLDRNLVGSEQKILTAG